MAERGLSRKPTQDAGWSWVIAAACCWITFVIQGLVRSSGFIYVAVIDTYEVTRGQASWPFTLRIALWNLSGPLAGALSYKWSIRTITFVGILVVTAGYVVCWVASDITIVTVFLGVVQGFGIGISVTLIPVIINQYFVKYKSTGAGIACAGGTAGSFALSPVVELAIEEYGLSGAFLMMGGMTLHGILGAALMRPAEWLKNTPTYLPQRHSKNNQCDHSSQGNTESSQEDKPFLHKDPVNLAVFSSSQNIHLFRYDVSNRTPLGASKNGSVVETAGEVLVDTPLLIADNILPTACMRNGRSDSRIDCIPALEDASRIGKEEMLSKNSILFSSAEGHKSLKPSISQVSTIPTEICPKPNTFQAGVDSLCTPNEDLPNNDDRQRFLNEDGKYEPRINVIQLQTQRNNIRDLSNLNDIRQRYGKYGHSDIISKTDHAVLERCPSKWRFKLGGLLEPVKAASSIMMNPMFLLIAFNYSVFFLSYMTYLIVIVDYALDLGISRTDSVFLVSAFSVADFCGRLGSGWITDSGYVKRRNFLMTNMTIVGILLISISFSNTYIPLMAFSVATGVVVGMNLIIFYALLEEYLGLQKMAMAVGLMNFFIGCLSLVTPILTGIFRDTLGTYIYLFHFLGAVSVFCGLMWALESVVSAYRRPKDLHVEDDFRLDVN